LSGRVILLTLPHRICPKCQAPGRLLESSSQAAEVEYYRCDACGHVWNLSKADPNAPARDVTMTKVVMPVDQ
jgi:rubredoxin